MSPDLRLAAPPPRAQLLRELRSQLPMAEPGLRVVAQELLGAGSRIDLLAVDAHARAVVILVGDAADPDPALLARGLAQRAWVAPRVDDWLQLAPELGVRPRAGVRLLLLAPRFDAALEEAAAALGDERPELWPYTCVQNGTGVAVLLAPPTTAPGAPAPPAPEPAPPRTEAPSPAPAASGFRTGLDESDLGLTAAERREFD